MNDTLLITTLILAIAFFAMLILWYFALLIGQELHDENKQLKHELNREKDLRRVFEKGYTDLKNKEK